MKKRILLVVLLISLHIKAQVPSNYYNSANGLSGYALKSELSSIISNGHVNRGYSNLYNGYKTTDTDNYYENDGTVLDIYSEKPNGTDPYNYTHNNNKCGNYSSEGDCYNREHLMPQSWFSSHSPMKADIHHVVPSDGKVNGQRGNYPLADVSSASWTSQNGSKRGSCGDAGYNGTVFEPIDEFKGDVARIYFYMATRYESQIGSWQNANASSDAVLNGSSDQVFEDWYLDVLLQWHNQDPVSQRELDRNNAAYDYQGNANPFINHPEWVDSIWGNGGTPPPTSTYCNSKGEDVSDEYIQRVKIGSINKASGSGNGYSDFTSISTDLSKGSSVTITITPKWTGTTYNEAYAVWIDYNQDGDFIDSGEKVWSKAASKTTPVSGTFTIPSGADIGNTRMRVSMKYNGIPTSCETFQYGEVEDYTVNIINGGGSPTCTDTTLTINFDNYPSETSWEIKDNSGAVVFSGGTYGSQTQGSTLVISNCLPSGCYTFIMKDSYGDGMCCSYGSGSYSLVQDDNGNSLASGASFNNTDVTNFCVGSNNRSFNTKSKTITSKEIQIFPNPALNNISIRLRDKKMKNFRIIDLLGQTVIKGEVTDKQIDISMLKNGVYQIVFTSDKKRLTSKLIKE